jgi:hypothetical protein
MADHDETQGFDDGGPAFPGCYTNPMYAALMQQEKIYVLGMSLRGWYAGMAMQGLITLGSLRPDSDFPEETEMTTGEIIATRAYLFADAMIAAGKEKPDDQP